MYAIRSYYGLGERVHLRWGDVTDSASVRAALDGVDAVVHLAAILTPERAPDLARRVNRNNFV